MKKTLFLTAILGSVFASQAFATWASDGRCKIDGTATSFSYTSDAEAAAGLSATDLTYTTYGVVRADGASADMTISSFAAKDGDTIVVLTNPWENIDFSNLTFTQLNVADSGSVSLDVRNTNKITLTAIDGSISSLSVASTAAAEINANVTIGSITNNGSLTLTGNTSITGAVTTAAPIVNTGTVTLGDDATVNITTFTRAYNYSEMTASGAVTATDTYTAFTGEGTVSGLTEAKLLLNGTAASGGTLTGNSYAITASGSFYYVTGGQKGVASLTSYDGVYVDTTGILYYGNTSSIVAFDKAVGTGNMEIDVNISMSNVTTQLTGSLSVDAGKTLTLYSYSATTDISSFSSVVLNDGSKLTINNAGAASLTESSAQNLTVNGSATLHLADGAGDGTDHPYTLSGKTTLNDGASLTLTHNWGSALNIEALTGNGDVTISGTGQEGALYNIGIADTTFSGKLTLNSSDSSVTVTLGAAADISSSKIVNTASSSLTLAGSGTYRLADGAAFTDVTYGSAWTGTVDLGSASATISDRYTGSVIVGSGSTLTLEGNNTSSARVAGDITVEAGGTLACTTNVDAFGYGSTKTASISLSGSEDSVATMTTTHRQTIQGNTFTLGGNTVVKAGENPCTDTGNTPMLDFASSADTITVTGTNNEIAVDMRMNASGRKVTIDTGSDSANALTINADVYGGDYGTGTLAITGSGSVTVNGTISTTLEGKINSGTNGGLTLSGALKNVTLGTGTFTLDGASGYLATGETTIAADIVLGTNGFTSSDGNGGDKRTFTGSISGSGNIIRSAAGTIQNFVFKGDVSNWTGAFKATNTNGFTTNVTFSGSATTVNAAVTKEGTSNTLNLTAGADSDQTFSGAVTVDQLTVSAGKNVEMTGALDASTLVLESGASLNLTAGDTTISNITLTASTITLGEHTPDLTATTVSVSGASTINADLIMSGEGNSISFAHGATLTMGCSITTGGTKIVISDADYNTIISGIGSTYNVNGDGSGDEIIKLITGVDGTDVTSLLANSTVYSASGDTDSRLKLGYNASGDGYVYVTPEPATATLSLLALAGLAARRRRH